MTILVYKDGRWLIDNEQPLEGVSLDNLAAILSNPKDGDVVKYDEESGMWISGGGLPPVTPSDNGKVLGVVDGAWAAENNVFIVTVTGGKADKTLAEVTAAFNAGKEIYADVSGSKYFLSSLDASGAHFTAIKKTANVAYVCLLNTSNNWQSDSKAFVPTATISKAGKTLKVNSSGQYELVDTKFIVTLTPYDETFSGGVMDKTVGEIKQAVDAGMEVWFQVTLNENLTGLYVCNGIDHYPNAPFEYVFVAMAVLNFGNYFLVRIATSSDSEDATRWFSTIFPLTPAS